MQIVTADNDFERLRGVLQLPELWFQAHSLGETVVIPERVIRQLLEERDGLIRALKLITRLARL